MFLDALKSNNKEYSKTNIQLAMFIFQYFM